MRVIYVETLEEIKKIKNSGKYEIINIHLSVKLNDGTIKNAIIVK